MQEAAEGAPPSLTTKQHEITDDSNRLRSVFVGYTVSAVFWLLLATAAGLVLAYKLGARRFRNHRLFRSDVPHAREAGRNGQASSKVRHLRQRSPQRGIQVSTSQVRIYLDDDPEPIVNDLLPADVALDTRVLPDGAHRLTVHATDENGNEGVEEITFKVRNGPGIVVSGLRPNSTRAGIVHLGVDAFSADDPFDPRRAEARSSIPTWVFVMSLFIVAWAVWYAASMWQVPEPLRASPTYSSYERGESAPHVGDATTPAAAAGGGKD